MEPLTRTGEAAGGPAAKMRARARPWQKKGGVMMRNKRKTHRGTTLIALLAIVAVLAAATGAIVPNGFGFSPDASWVEGA